MMNLFLKRLILGIFLVMVIFQLSGCGETLQGITKDATRMGKGVKTIFIRDSE
jgi:predicted small secreted protein